jgi:hypothetical protein
VNTKGAKHRLAQVVLLLGAWCAREQSTSPGQVVSWGFPSGPTNVPAGFSDIEAVAAPRATTETLGYILALRSDGSLASLGGVYVPIGLSNVVGIAAGEYVALALKNDGTVAAWQPWPFINAGDETNVPAG